MKTLKSLFDDIGGNIGNDPSYSLFAVGLHQKGDSDGYSLLWEKSICSLEIDEKNKEVCLLIDEELKGINVEKILRFKNTLDEAVCEYAICACTKETVDGYDVRIDMPVIGFGQSSEEKKYAVMVIESKE